MFLFLSLLLVFFSFFFLRDKFDNHVNGELCLSFGKQTKSIKTITNMINIRDTHTNLRIENSEKKRHNHTTERGIVKRRNFLFSRHCNSCLKSFCFFFFCFVSVVWPKDSGRMVITNAMLVTHFVKCTHRKREREREIDKRFIWSIFYSNEPFAKWMHAFKRKEDEHKYTMNASLAILAKYALNAWCFFFITSLRNNFTSVDVLVVQCVPNEKNKIIGISNASANRSYCVSQQHRQLSAMPFWNANLQN